MGLKIKRNVLVKYKEEKGVTEVVIPDRVTEIGEWDFKYCKNITSIIIPKSVSKINCEAFYGCTNLKNIIIPEGITKLFYGTFYGCTNLENMIIPKSVTEIDNDVFSSCEKLESIEIPENVTVIGAGAFKFCRKLKNVVIPESVTKIGGLAFYNTKWLKEKRKENFLVIVNNIIIDASKCKDDVVIPKGIIGISEFALSNKWIKSVEIPESVEYIGNLAFNKGTNLILKKGDIKVRIKLLGDWNRKADEKAFATFFNDRIKKNFSEINKSAYKIPMALFMTLANFEEESVFKGYVKRNIRRVVKYLIDNGDVENLVKLLPFGFVTAKNIDDLVVYANDKKQTEMQIKLMNYKHDYIGYKETVLRI